MHAQAVGCLAAACRCFHCAVLTSDVRELVFGLGPDDTAAADCQRHAHCCADCISACTRVSKSVQSRDWASRDDLYQKWRCFMIASHAQGRRAR